MTAVMHDLSGVSSMVANAVAVPHDNAFLRAFHGSLTSTLRWHDLDAFWAVLRERAAAGWYVYALGETPPQTPVATDKLNEFIAEMDALLRKEHQEDYCAIVFADDLNAPTLVKIYDPNNLGVSCGSSDNPPLPGWVLSLEPPVDIVAMAHTASRKRWWQKIFA
jgi:hypothetical protein